MKMFVLASALVLSSLIPAAADQPEGKGLGLFTARGAGADPQGNPAPTPSGVLPGRGRFTAESAQEPEDDSDDE
jgi:hypothetical protein